MSRDRVSTYIVSSAFASQSILVNPTPLPSNFSFTRFHLLKRALHLDVGLSSYTSCSSSLLCAPRAMSGVTHENISQDRSVVYGSGEMGCPWS